MAAGDWALIARPAGCRCGCRRESDGDAVGIRGQVWCQAVIGVEDRAAGLVACRCGGAGETADDEGFAADAGAGG